MPLDHSRLPSNVSTEFRVPSELIARDDVAIPEYYAWQAKANPNYPLFVYQDGDQLGYVTYAQANRAMDRVARYVTSVVQSSKRGHGGERPVVALFANAGTCSTALSCYTSQSKAHRYPRTDTITYFCTAIGVMRTGYTVFLVSTRNAAAAISDMFKRTGTGHVILSHDPFLRGTAQDALADVASAGQDVVELEMPSYQDLFAEQLEASSPYETQVDLPRSYDVDAVGVIMHSSGEFCQ